MRRDITINSMFWNIHTEEIEDFTGHGILTLKMESFGHLYRQKKHY